MLSITSKIKASPTCMKFGKHKKILNNFLLNLSDKYKNKSYFLDIGCGDGEKTLLFDNNRTLHGIDCLDWRTKETKEKVFFYKTDLMANVQVPIPFHPHIIFSFDTIEHMPNPEKMLQFAKENLHFKGVLIIGTPNRIRLGTLGLRKFPYNPDGNKDKYAAHLREYTVKELKQLLKDNGFTVIKTHKLFYGITNWLGFDTFFGLPLFHHIIVEAIHAD